MRALTLLTYLFILLFIYSCSTESTQVYNLTTSVNPPQAGSVTQSATGAEQGETITVAATANENWFFTGWGGDHSGSQNPVSIVMDRDKSITALFDKQQYRLTVDIIGEGEVEQRVVQARSQQYPHGAIVELTAVPQTGWAFSRWEGDAEGNENPIEITIEEEAAITAVFEVIEYPLSINIIGEGRVDQKVVQAKSTEYPYGTVVELTATGEQGWAFLSWDGDLQGGETPQIITITEPKEVTATFLRAYNLTTLAQPQEGGMVTPQDTVLVRDTDVEVKAIANYGWQFVNWEGDFSGSVNPFLLTMNGNKTLVANFEREEFTLEIDTEGGGNVSVELLSGTQTADGFLFESVVEITAIPQDGWKFVEWSGDVDGTSSTVELVMDGNKTVSVLFEIKPADYSIDLSLSDGLTTFTLLFGQSVDAETLRTLAPPAPPPGALNAYFIDGSDRLIHDYRPENLTTITWTLAYSKGLGDSLELSWILNTTEIPGTLILTDEENTFETDMKTSESLSLEEDEGILLIRYSLDTD